MVLYRYQKKFSEFEIPSPPRPRITKKRQLISYGLLISGLVLFGNLIIFYSSWFLSNTYQGFNNPLLRAKTDWLDGSFGSVLGEKSGANFVYQQFYLTVPALKINRAVVTTNVNSDKQAAYLPILNKSIAHYKDTSLPGEDGNSFLYGHSVLPKFFNKNDYLTIFSTLHQLQIGDLIIVNYGVDQFQYQVYAKNIVEPAEIEVVNTSKVGEKTLTLMTCSPPGTTLKRLLVSAQIVE